jgi:hypothetical protein
MEKNMRARPLTPEEIEALTREQILEAVSFLEDNAFIMHCGEVMLIDYLGVDELADPDRELHAWERVDPVISRAAKVAWYEATQAWRIENKRLQAESKRIAALQAESERIAALIKANDERRHQAYDAYDRIIYGGQ